MLEDDNLSADAIRSINLLPSCAQIGALLPGKTIHDFAVRKGFLPHLILETALVDMHGKCGVVLWNDMIAAYVQVKYVY